MASFPSVFCCFDLAYCLFAEVPQALLPQLRRLSDVGGFGVVGVDG